MDWKTEALARARKARMQANNLRHDTDSLYHSLYNLEGYDVECGLMTDVVDTVNGIIKDLFELEGELSQTA